MNDDISNAEGEVIEAQANVKKAIEDSASMQEQLEEAQAQHQEVEAALADEVNKMSAFKEELLALENAIQAKEGELQSRDEEQTLFENEIEKITKEIKACNAVVSALVKECPWIEDERE